MLEDLDNEAIGKLVLGINKMQSPACPDKTAVYLGPRFMLFDWKKMLMFEMSKEMGLLVANLLPLHPDCNTHMDKTS